MSKFQWITIFVFGMMIITFIITIFIYYNRLSTCENNQSPYCLSIVCPNEPDSDDICQGLAQRKREDGSIQCAV
jgi:hypothetical protein